MQPLVNKGAMLYFAMNNLETSWWNHSTMHICRSKWKQVHRLRTDLYQSRPADIIVQDCDQGRPAAFNICVVSPLNSNVLSAAGATAGAASAVAELRKHTANDAKCIELGWVSIQLMVESSRARRLASRLLSSCMP